MTSVLAGVRSRDSLDNQALVTDNYARTHIVLERRSLQEQIRAGESSKFSWEGWREGEVLSEGQNIKIYEGFFPLRNGTFG